MPPIGESIPRHCRLLLGDDGPDMQAAEGPPVS
jgi:hypothetical protein